MSGVDFSEKLFCYKFFPCHISYRTARCAITVPVSHFHQILLPPFQGMVVNDMFRKPPDRNLEGNPGFQESELHVLYTAFNAVTCPVISYFSGFSIQYLQNDIRFQSL